MHFSPQAFDMFLGRNGVLKQDYGWYKADVCPCIDRHSGASNPGCQLCFGKGRVFATPIIGVAALAGAKTQREWAQFGVYEQGDVVVTISEESPIYEIGQYDRVTAYDSSLHFSEVLRHDGGPKERLFFSVRSVTRVFWLTDNQSKIVDGGIPLVAPNGTLSWPDGQTPPPAGAAYTIAGTKFIDYFCFGPYQQNRMMNQGSRLPRKVILRDFDLFNR